MRLDDLKRGRAKWIAIVLAFLLVLAGTAAVILARHWPFSEDTVTQALQDAFGGTVSFARFHGTRFPHPGFVAEGVILSPSSKPSAPALVTIQTLTMQASYADLFLRPGYIERVVLAGMHIQVPAPGSGLSFGPTVAQGKDSLSNVRLGQIIADGTLLEVARHDANPPLKFVIHSLTLRSVSRDQTMSYEVALTNALPTGEIHSAGHFGPWNSNNPAQTPVSGTDKFERADLSTFDGIAGTLSSDDDFQGTLGHIEARGSIEIPDFSVTQSHHAVRVSSRYEAVIDGTNGDVVLKRVEGSFLKTSVVAFGSVAAQSGHDGKTTSIDLVVSQGRIQDVLRLFVRAPTPPFNGTTSFRAHVTVFQEGRPFLHEVRLEGDFGVAGGRFTTADTQTSVAKLSERASGKNEDEGPNDDPERVISDLFGHAMLKNGTATLTDLSFGVPGARAQMHGTYNLLSEKIDLHGTLKTDATFSKDTTGVKSVLLKPFNVVFKTKRHGAVLPVQLTGTYSDPHPGLELVPKM